MSPPLLWTSLKRPTHRSWSCLLAALVLTACASERVAPHPRTASGGETRLVTIPTRSGELTFENGFEVGIPAPQTVEALFDEIDYQRACQSYLWAMPLMGFYEWMFVHDRLGVERGQVVYHESYQSKLGGLTFNTSTPYVVTFVDLREGPLRVDIPDAPVRGAMHSMWQVGITQMTEPGAYVLLGPGMPEPAELPESAQVFRTDTSQAFLGLRLMSDTHEQRMEDLRGIRLTNLSTQEPLSEEAPFFQETGVDLKQARGMAYWESLHKALSMTPVREQDRIIVDFLRPLGIEIGEPFAPDDRQRELLEQAVLVGEAMAKTIDFNKTGRLAQSEYGPEGNTWEIATASSPDQDRDQGVDLDGRAAWFYEAVTNDVAMHGMENGGWGQVYLDNYRDSEHNGLNGGFHYSLTVPGDVPIAETFWTVTVYNVDNRAIIDNDLGRADVGSNIEGTVRNDDGSYTFHFAPQQPDGVAVENWVQTNPGENWFVYFRAYSPSEGFVAQDPRTILSNFVRVD